jgi:MFS family permease
MPTPPDGAKTHAIGARRLYFLFGLAYFAQGLGQAGGLISQPLNYYLKQGLGLNTAQVADYLAILTLPWMIKPIYGLVSDYIPLFSYRRKTWLMLVNIVAALGFLWLSDLTDAGTIVTAIMLTAFGTASSDVIIDALMVENGERTGLTARFQGIQWLWFRFAAIVTALTGGYLAALFEPASALHMAATITMLAPLSVLLASYLLVHEERSTINMLEARQTTREMIAAFRSPVLRIAAVFLTLWCLSPAFGTPLYYHMVDNLRFEQHFIGHLNALMAVGGVIGAWLFTRVFADRTITFRATFSIFAGVAGVLSYMSLAQPGENAAQIAVPINIFVGTVAQIGMLTIFSMAAAACPPRAAGFAFAALMSIYNGVEQFSAVIGSRLYDQAFDRSIAPLLWVAAISLLCCLALLPWMRRLDEDRSARQYIPVDG